MGKILTPFFKNTAILIGILILSLLLPDAPLTEGIDISLKKICQILLAVSGIQLFGIIIYSKANAHAGVLIHGMISGIISSTAFMVHLSKKSTEQDEESQSIESLGFLSATSAMLIQGIVLYLITTKVILLSTLSLFLIPLFVTVILIIKRTIHTQDRQVNGEEIYLDWFVIAKLALFVIIIIVISNLIKNYLGDVGLRIVTFLISLFELHGMVIANTQLMVSQKINLSLFNELMTLTVLASYVSKVIIVFSLGSKYLRKKVLNWTGLISLSLILAWFLNKI